MIIRIRKTGPARWVLKGKACGKKKWGKHTVLLKEYDHAPERATVAQFAKKQGHKLV